MKIAFIYDRINKFGGAERVLLALHEIWPDAPLYTAVYNKDKAQWADVFKVKPSFLRHLPFSASLHEFLPLFTPIAFESMNLGDFDVILSITSSDAKAIITKPSTLHFCYCLTPTRYLWSGFAEYIKEPGMSFLNPVARILMRFYFYGLRKWDFISSSRPDFYISISETIKKRIKSYYKRDSIVIYPPVDVDTFTIGRGETKKDFYLIVSRLVPYKKIDYVIKAFNKLKRKLVIIGIGIDEDRLRSLSCFNIEFMVNHLTDERLRWYYQNCRALIFPGEEDFGISAVEAQACGKPVIGLKSGGIGEIIKPGLTGEIYNFPNESEIISALEKSLKRTYLKTVCRENAIRFSKKNFQQSIKLFIENEWEKSK